MKIVVASDSFKGSITSDEIGEVIKKAVTDIDENHEVIIIPMADGGEGTVDAFLTMENSQKVTCKINHPTMNKKIDVYYSKNGNLAVIEVAQAVGLPLIEDNKQPILASSFGVGEIICHALENDCTEIIIGLGGSCTTDGGIGMAAALGFEFFGNNNLPVSLDGNGIGAVKTIKSDKLMSKLKSAKIMFACDVQNPLYGKMGAAHIFAPQKGATSEQVKILDNNLRNFAKCIFEHTNVDLQVIAGSGGAGGMASVLTAFLGTPIKEGVEIIMDIHHFKETIKDADLVFTGEGKIDSQSFSGKVPISIAKACKENGIPVVVLTGGTVYDIEKAYENGVSAIFPISRYPKPLSECIKDVKIDLYYTTKDIVRLLIDSKNHKKTIK